MTRVSFNRGIDAVFGAGARDAVMRVVFTVAHSGGPCSGRLSGSRTLPTVTSNEVRTISGSGGFYVYHPGCSLDVTRTKTFAVENSVLACLVAGKVGLWR
jgi:hypothetical protein